MASQDRTPTRPTVPRGRHAPPLEVRLAQQRERLFEAAASVFATTGYADASAESISRAAGMSKATFYEHFANKEECILALFDAAYQVLLSRILGAVAEAGEDPVARMREGMREFLVVIDEYPNEAQTLLVEIIGAGPAAMRRRDEIVASFAQVLFRENETHAQEGVMPRFKSPVDAFAIVGAIAELVSRQLRLGEPEHSADLQPVIERFAFGLLGLEPPPLPRRRVAAAPRPRAAPLAPPTPARRSPRWTPRSSPAAAARGSSTGASGSRPRSAPRSPTRRTGAGRSPASATRPRASSCSGWRPPRTAATAPAASSPATARATGCSRRCGAAGSRTSRESRSRDDGLELRGAYVTAAVRCAPPANKPLPAERDNCFPYLRARAGAAARRCARSSASAASRGTRRCAPAPRSASRRRGRSRASATAPSWRRPDRWPLLGCYHPSQQNTFTGRLTEPMIDAVFLRARELAGSAAHRSAGALSALSRRAGCASSATGKRPKSRSAVHSSRTPCSRQIAAMRASWIIAPRIAPQSQREVSRVARDGRRPSAEEAQRRGLGPRR